MERVFVWLGGALFVASLASTAWIHLTRFAVSRPPGGWQPVVVDAALMTCFALHHSLFARDSTKRTLARIMPERLVRSMYVWVASLLLIAVCTVWWPVGGSLYHATGRLAWPFTLVQIAGLSLIALSVSAIDPLELAGIRRGSQSPLQTGGVYRIVRHPLYFGWVLLVFGPAHMTGDRLAFAVLTTAYLIVAVPWEERGLIREFGAAYEQYCKQVRWRMLPGFY